MNDLPLKTFLSELAADGIRLTVHDYERIRLVLQTGGPWTMTRLRDTLLSLLAKDPDRQDLFLRHFNRFFERSLEAENAPPELDIEPVLADLKQLVDAHRVPPKQSPVRRLVRRVVPQRTAPGVNRGPSKFCRINTC